MTLDIAIMTVDAIPMKILNQLSEEEQEALVMVVEAAEKQVPMEPIYSDFEENDDGDGIIPFRAVCPVCNREFEFGTWNEEDNHHCSCDQKIDWNGK